MKKVILPIAELINQYGACENLLSFYKGGLHGLVVDTIHCCCIDYFNNQDTLHCFYDKVLNDYNNSSDAIWNLYNENTKLDTFLLILLETIACLINEVISTFFTQMNKFVFNKKHEWLGNDLIIIIETPFTHE